MHVYEDMVTNIVSLTSAKSYDYQLPEIFPALAITSSPKDLASGSVVSSKTHSHILPLYHSLPRLVLF